MDPDATPTWKLITSGYMKAMVGLIPMIGSQAFLALTAASRSPLQGDDLAITRGMIVFYSASLLLHFLDLLLKTWRAHARYSSDATVRRFEFSQEDWKHAVHFMAARDMVPGKNDVWYYNLLKKRPVVEIREKSILVAGEVLMEEAKVLAPERFLVNRAENRLEVTFIRKRLRGLRFFPREDVEFSNRIDVPLHATAVA